MGYTHYWTMTRDLSREEWADVSADIGEILSYVENMAGVPLANGEGAGGTRPEITADRISFNGVGDDSHETFHIPRKRKKAWSGGRLGGDFCKTARKPYDIAVIACLCYLDTCLEPRAITVSSDGNGHNFLAGLEAARQALPRKANVLDIPMGIMQDDRWTGPWVSNLPNGYEVQFCINGKAYVLHKGESYRFNTHLELGRFLDANKHAHFRRGGSTSFGRYSADEPNIWRAMGCFDPARHQRIARAQAKVLAQLFPVPVEHAEQPPAYARPMDFPRPEDNGTFCYDLSELIAKADKLSKAA